MDIEKELKQLKTKIDLLEKLLKKNNLFGSSYSSVGSSSSDYLIKTRGKVKIQIGNKFIDLIKDGAINSDSKFIYKEKEVGTKDGIYVIEDGSDSKVILSINGLLIDLKGEIGTTYVSFLGDLLASQEQLYLALKNIGFIFDNLSQAYNIKGGIVYIEELKKLYILKDGNLLEYSIDIPNPYPNQFVIKKDNFERGSLVISGEGINNSLKFNSLCLYSEKNNTYFNSDGPIYFTVSDDKKIIIDDFKSQFLTSIESNKIQSVDATEDQGFRLLNENGTTTLEVDYLKARHGINSYDKLYPTFWYLNNNIIKNIESVDSENGTTFEIELLYENKFNVGDNLYVYNSNNLLFPFIISEISDTIISVYTTEENYNIEDLCNYIKGGIIFLVGSDNHSVFLKRDSQNIDLIKSSCFEDNSNLENINIRIGNIEELSLKEKNNNSELNITGYGIYSDNSCFKNAKYISLYELSSDDNSSKFASTEWVRNNAILPIGTIIMFNGEFENIPEQWHICDGTNGTPNLIDKFIKASNTSGIEGGNSSIQLTEENLPKHTHTLTKTSLITELEGDHVHSINADTIKISDTGKDVVTYYANGNTGIATRSEGLHSHNIDISDLKLNYTGEGKPIDWLPSYYSLIFIMKIK